MRRRGVRAAAFVMVLGALIALPVLGADERSVLPPRPDNAAINYLIAAARLEKAKTEADIKAIAFIEGDFQKLPPGALKGRPDAVVLLEREAADNGPMLNIHAGAVKPTCQFDVDWEEGPAAPLWHLILMRNLARHAIAVAEYHEFTGHPEKAAAIYSDVQRMAAHVAEEPLVISGLVGLAVSNMNVRAVGGFLAAEPPLDAIRELMAGLARVPERPFPIDRWLLGEVRCYGAWLQRHPEDLPGLNIKDRPDKEDLVREYREDIQKFAALAREPYFKSGEAVNALQAAIGKRLDDANTDPARDNPVIRAVCPDAAALYVQYSVGEARLRMLRILAAAAMHKAEAGAYPDTLEKLAKYFPKGMPNDPFTGKDFRYALKEGLPDIESDMPERVLSATSYRPGWYSLNLSVRRQKDADALKEFLEKRAAE